MNNIVWTGYAGLMLVAGFGIPILAALNAGLGARIGSPLLATVLAFAVALGCALVTVAIAGVSPTAAAWRAAPAPFYAGGAFMAFYLLSITWVAPRFGVGNAIFFVLLGQMASAAAIDHFGLAGSPRVSLDGMRALGLLLMVVGVLLARRRAGT